MKNTITLLLVLIVAPLIVQSQTFVWKTPQPVSDSIAVNKNPVIGMIDYFVLWTPEGSNVDKPGSETRVQRTIKRTSPPGPLFPPSSGQALKERGKRGLGG